jgi:hypothetical protein
MFEPVSIKLNFILWGSWVLRRKEVGRPIPTHCRECMSPSFLHNATRPRIWSYWSSSVPSENETVVPSLTNHCLFQCLCAHVTWLVFEQSVGSPIFFFFFETESLYVTHKGLEFTTLLSQPSECWGHRCGPSGAHLLNGKWDVGTQNMKWHHSDFKCWLWLLIWTKPPVEAHQAIKVVMTTGQ